MAGHRDRLERAIVRWTSKPVSVREPIINFLRREAKRSIARADEVASMSFLQDGRAIEAIISLLRAAERTRKPKRKTVRTR